MPVPASATDLAMPLSVMLDYGTSCQMSIAQDLAFGVAPITLASGSVAIGSAINAQGLVTVNCSNGTSYTIYAPLSGNANGSQRRLKNGSSYFNYSISAVSAGGTVVPTTQASATAAPYARTGGGYADAITIYGQVPAQTVTGSPPAGAYTDTISFTVSY